MNIAIYGRAVNANKSEQVQKLFDKLYAHAVTPYIYEPLFHFIKNTIALKGKYQLFNDNTSLPESIATVISIGGDGTLLDTLIFVKNKPIPILGINTGRLGFLASVSKDEIDFAVETLLAGNYELDKRSLLLLETKTNLFQHVNYALNDLTVHKNESSAMMTIHAYLNGAFLNSYWADGLIISTSTGSTAYSLSCGGPIVIPGTKNFIITPVAPHNLNVRPIVISDESILTLKVESRTDKFLTTLDSRSEIVNADVELKIKRADFDINLIKLPGHDFLSTLRNKLMWGIDKRN
jgi:NAD+ kinase